MPRDSVRINDKDVSIDKALGRIDFDRLPQEVQETGAQAVWYGILMADAKFAVENSKTALDVAKADVGLKFRLKKERESEKVTEGMIAEAVTLDSKIATAKLALFTAERDAKIIETIYYRLDRKQSTLEALIRASAQDHPILRNAYEALRDDIRARAQSMKQDSRASRRQPIAG